MITYNVETISPIEAHQMLKGNFHNRKLIRAHIERLSEIMLRGEWRLNGESIKLNGNMLLDGQHRLEGCVLANKSFKTLVIRGLRDDVQGTIDNGKIRTVAHHFQMTGELYSTLLANAVNKVIGYYSTERNVAKPKYVSNVQAEKFLLENPALREIVHHHGASGQTILGRGIAAACHFIFDSIDSDAANQFINALTKGEGLDAGSPILALRGKFIKDLSTERKLSTTAKFGLTIKTWNYWRDGKTIKPSALRYVSQGETAEKFPVAH